jgi:hypothetical protein
VTLDHGSPIRGLLDCIMRPTATSVNYVYAIGLIGPVRLFGVTLVVIFFFFTHGPRTSPQ